MLPSSTGQDTRLSIWERQFDSAREHQLKCNMKICKKCNTQKQLGLFNRNPSKKDGLQPYCKSCTSLQHKTWYQTNKQHVIDKTKAYGKSNIQRLRDRKHALGCSLCSETEMACMDFHHKDPAEKEYSLSAMVSFSWPVIEKELQKCICVCKNCHSKIHAGLITLLPQFTGQNAGLSTRRRRIVTVREYQLIVNGLRRARYTSVELTPTYTSRVLIMGGTGKCSQLQSRIPLDG